MASKVFISRQNVKGKKEWLFLVTFNLVLSDQCKEIEENNTMGKTRDLFKKIRDTKGTFHAKMSTIKDRNSIQKQKILRRGGKNKQKNCTKKIFTTQITTMVWSLT